MALAPDSTTAGYLGPTTLSLDGLSWENFLQAVVVGITQLSPDLVRPRWQQRPPNTPDLGTNWVGAGITRTVADWMPALVHYPNSADGYDELYRNELVTYSLSFYGPQCDDYAAIFRDGIFIEQNRGNFRPNAVGLVAVDEVIKVPELFRQQWRDRVDLDCQLRRQVRRTYNVRNLVGAQVQLLNNILESDITVGPVP